MLKHQENVPKIRRYKPSAGITATGQSTTWFAMIKVSKTASFDDRARFIVCQKRFFIKQHDINIVSTDSSLKNASVLKV